jgi:D-alanyl-D-alanine carboxypeptidase
MLHRRSDRHPGPPARRPAPRALGAVLALVAFVPAACMSVTPPPATQPPPATVGPETGAVTGSSAPVATPAPTPEPAATPASTLQAASPAAAVTPALTLDPGTTPIPEVRWGSTVTPELSERLDGILAQWKKAAQVPGVVAALRMPDGTVWYGGAGKAILPPGGEKATPDTPWVIGSITKTFVAALAFKLQEEGRLSLDDPISTWLPDVANGRKITLRMLLNHTSGLADYFWHPDYADLVYGRPTYHFTVDEIVALAAERAPVFAPGAKQEYSNTNYILAGRILEAVGGEPLATQLRTRFLDPLDLTSVVFQGDEEVPDGAAKGYWKDGSWVDWSDGTTLRPMTSAATVVWAAGALLSSVRDLLRWEAALYGGEVLSSESLAQLLTFGPAGYGPGTRYQRMAGWDGYGHGGSLRGFQAGMYRLPEAGVDVIVMTNRGDVTMDPTLLASDLVKAAVGRKPGTGNRRATPEPSIAP